MLRLLETVDEGRFVVANKSIAAGTLVHVSAPYSVILSQPATLSNCYYCLEKVPVPRSVIQPTAALASTNSNSAAGGGTNNNNVKKEKGVGKNPQKSASYLAMKAQLKQRDALAKKKNCKKQENELLAVEREADDPLSSQPSSAHQPPLSSTQQEGDGSDTVLCPHCQVASYCSSRCLQAHQLYHTRSQECTALREVYRHASHRRPKELLFASIVLQMILRCYAEGSGAHLRADPAASRDSCGAGPDVNPTEEGTNHKEDAEGAKSDAPTAVPPPSQGGAAGNRDVSQSSSIPADALKLHALRLKYGTEVLDPKAAASEVGAAENNNSWLDDMLSEWTDKVTSRIGRSATSATLESELGQLVAPAWERVRWSDVGRLVTNVSLMTRECVSEFHTLHRFVLSVIAQMPVRYFPGVDVPASATVVDKSAVVVSPQRFHAICAVLQCNGFGVHDAADRSIAIGLFPSASYWNHDCNPNLARVMLGRTATFFALRDIAEGEPLTISYADVEAPCSERRYRMLVTYRFYCQCTRCAGSSPLSCDRCSDCAARGYLRPLVEDSGAMKGKECTVCRKLHH